MGAALTPSQEQELLDGFLARKPMAELLLVSEIRPLVRAYVRNYRPKAWEEILDLEQAACLRLFELRETPEGRASIRPPLQAVAKLAADAPAHAEHRRKRPVALDGWDEPRPAGQEQAYRVKEVLEFATRLPGTLSKTLLCHVAEVVGEGPPLREALGVSQRQAHWHLVRAKNALMGMLEGEALTESAQEEIEATDG